MASMLDAVIARSTPPSPVDELSSVAANVEVDVLSDVTDYACEEIATSLCQKCAGTRTLYRSGEVSRCACGTVPPGWGEPVDPMEFRKLTDLFATLRGLVAIGALEESYDVNRGLCFGLPEECAS